MKEGMTGNEGMTVKEGKMMNEGTVKDRWILTSYCNDDRNERWM